MISMVKVQHLQCEGVDGIGSYGGPPERCENDALPNSYYCVRHQPEEDWDPDTPDCGDV